MVGLNLSFPSVLPGMPSLSFIAGEVHHSQSTITASYPLFLRPVPPPRLRPWQGFGNGCSVQEHIDYGACLDGHCCTRHSVERKNALRVVQFLGGGQRQRRGRDRGQRQGRSANGNCGRRNERVDGLQQILRPNTTRSRKRPSDPLSPSSSPPQSERRDQSEEKPNGFSCSSARGNDDSSVEADRRVSDGSSPSPLFSSSSPNRAEPVVGFSSADTSTIDESTAVSSVASGGGASVGVFCNGEARAAARKKTPLHFASERGELALVDR